ncbi:hypothetical protein GEMRC1_004885 [Eukaryota sp. GEM-RC1]
MTQEYTDEVDALESMYPTSVHHLSGYTNFIFSVIDPDFGDLTLSFSPTQSPSPSFFTFSLQWSQLTKQQLSLLEKESLNHSNSLFDLISFLQDSALTYLSPTPSNAPPSSLEYPHPIIELHSFEDRKSVFQAFVSKCQSNEESKLFLSVILQNFPKTQQATHNCHVSRSLIKGQLSIVTDDDGETGASMAMLRLLEKMKAENVVVVVARWFGGVLLGPTRFRHFVKATKEAVDVARGQNLID